MVDKRNFTIISMAKQKLNKLMNAVECMAISIADGKYNGIIVLDNEIDNASSSPLKQIQFDASPLNVKVLDDDDNILELSDLSANELDTLATALKDGKYKFDNAPLND